MGKAGFLLIFITIIAVPVRAQGEPAAQTRKPAPELSIGAGYGRGFSVLKWQGEAWIFRSFEFVEVSSSPVFTADFHIPAIGKFCLGAAVSYQSIRVAHRIETGDILDFGDRYDRLNFAIRPLFALPLSQGLQLHFGARAGYTFWTVTSNFGPPYHKPTEIPSAVSGQLFAGLRYSFGNVGIGFEAGFGTAPYLLQGQVFYRFR